MRLHETVLRMREWLDAAEADAAFRIPMTQHRAERFAFSLDGIG